MFVARIGRHGISVDIDEINNHLMTELGLAVGEDDAAEPQPLIRALRSFVWDYDYNRQITLSGTPDVSEPFNPTYGASLADILASLAEITHNGGIPLVDQFSPEIWHDDAASAYVGRPRQVWGCRITSTFTVSGMPYRSDQHGLTQRMTIPAGTYLITRAGWRKDLVGYDPHGMSLPSTEQLAEVSGWVCSTAEVRCDTCSGSWRGESGTSEIHDPSGGKIDISDGLATVHDGRDTMMCLTIGCPGYLSAWVY